MGRISPCALIANMNGISKGDGVEYDQIKSKYYHVSAGNFAHFAKNAGQSADHAIIAIR